MLGPVKRTYKLHIPQAYNLSNTLPLPLVLSFPGWGGNAFENEQDAQLISKAVFKKIFSFCTVLFNIRGASCSKICRELGKLQKELMTKIHEILVEIWQAGLTLSQDFLQVSITCGKICLQIFYVKLCSFDWEFWLTPVISLLRG